MVETIIENKYQALKAAQEAGVLELLFRKCIIPKYYEYYIKIYEHYLAEKAIETKHAQVITNTAEEFECSEMTVYNIKNKMES